MDNLYLKQIQIGPMANFTYLVGSTKTREVVAIDPAWDIAAIERQAAADGMKITGALVTHYHPDHCGGHLWGHDIPGVAELVAHLDVPVYAHAAEIPGLTRVTGLAASTFRTVESGGSIPVGDIAVTAVHTPGHTPGSLCFAVMDQLVSGDTLFLTGCGRVDLPGGNVDELYVSLHDRLGKLPDSTIILPGHNYDDKPSASLGEVRKINPYLRVSSLEEWKRMRL